MSEPSDPHKTTPDSGAIVLPGDKTVPEAKATELPSATAPTVPAKVEAGVSGFHFTPGRPFGNYELLAEVGRGGMGVVYKAIQKDLNRLVALKMVLAGTLSDDKDIQRFRTEAEAAGRLQHANIVQVYEVGIVEGCHFYSMEFIEGHSLSARLSAGPLSNQAAARYVQFIAQAVQYAHRHDILHRDLKPSNILLDADDQPHVADFGLAKKLDDSGQTRTGAVMGTPSYMSPEQAAGRIRELRPTSDVYSLGAILYELLTGRPPFKSETALDTLLQVLERQPAPPRLLNHKVDRDLETICLKCLEKDPKQRYASAEALAEDLQRFLNGDSISARSFNVFDRLTRTLDRNQYIGEFSTWGNMLLIFAGVVLLEHVFVTFVLRVSGDIYPRAWIVGARTAQFGIMAFFFWRQRSHTLLPTSSAERQLWSIWLGYITACIVVSLLNVELNRFTHQERQPLSMYPSWAVLTGVSFFVMGSNYWGWCYAIGIGFFGLAIAMPLNLVWAPLEFGLAWASALAVIGFHLRRLGRLAAREKEGPTTITAPPPPGRATHKAVQGHDSHE
jgi:serine/threonine protein kinase